MSTDVRPPVWVSLAVALVRRMPAGRYRLLHRVRRFVRRPFLARLSSRAGGCRFICDPRDTVASEACFTGMYEPQETQLVSHALGAGDVFVDVGANWGYFSLVGGGLVGRTGRVLALEPEPRLFALLSSNIALNGLSSVTPRQVAAGAGAGQVAFAAFDADSDNWGTSHAVVGAGAADFTCASVALDDLLDAEGIQQVDLLKIDVEGGELDVLDGIRRGLAAGRYHRILLEIHPGLLRDRGLTAEPCLARLLEAGYRLSVVDHSSRMHRRAARTLVHVAELMRPLESAAALGSWPHIFAVAPGVAALR